MEEGSGTPRRNVRTMLTASFAAIAGLVIILTVILALPASDNRLVKV